MSIKLADRSLYEPIGVVNNAQIRVGPHRSEERRVGKECRL